MLNPDLVSFVLREGILGGVLVNATSNAEAQNQVLPLAELVDFNSLLEGEKRENQK